MAQEFNTCINQEFNALMKMHGCNKDNKHKKGSRYAVAGEGGWEKVGAVVCVGVCVFFFSNRLKLSKRYSHWKNSTRIRKTFMRDDKVCVSMWMWVHFSSIFALHPLSTRTTNASIILHGIPSYILPPPPHTHCHRSLCVHMVLVSSQHSCVDCATILLPTHALFYFCRAQVYI